MKLRHRAFAFKFPVYSNWTVHVIFTTDLTLMAYKLEASENITILGADKLQETAEAFHVAKTLHTYLLFNYGISAGTIAHESWHAVHDLLKTIDAQIDNEIVAYHLGYIVDQITKFKSKLGGHNDDHRPSSKTAIQRRARRRKPKSGKRTH